MQRHCVSLDKAKCLMGANAIRWFRLRQAVLLLSGNEVSGDVRAQCGSSGDRFQSLSWRSESVLDGFTQAELTDFPNTKSALQQKESPFVPNHLML